MTVPSSCDVLTAAGRVARVRAVAVEDEAELLALHQRASDSDLYLRFFALPRSGLPGLVHRLLEPAREGRALGVELDGRLVAFASYVPTGAEEADVAFFVDAGCRGEGLATLLLEHLASAARGEGIDTFTASVLSENTAMLRVLSDCGFVLSREAAGGVTDVRLDLRAGSAPEEAVTRREQAAEVRSLTPLLAPLSVAVVGAGRRPGTVGHEVLRSLDATFTGALYAVNPAADEVAGVPAYPAVSAIPERVDLALVAVPAPGVEAAIGDCADAGVRAAVILSSNFGERGPEGRAAEQRLLRRARAAGMRLVGPNCLGLVNTDPRVGLTAVFASAGRAPGPLALASQSGAVGIGVLDAAERAGLGTAAFVSLGNKVDVSSNDLLLYWAADPRVRVVALYLESFGNPRKLARVARHVSASVPVLAVKAVRTDSGLRAGQSHTAAATTPDTAVDALFAAAGVVRLDTVGEMVDAARLLAGQPLPAGGRLAIVGNAGGAGILAADAAAPAGLRVAGLSDGLRQELDRLAPTAASTDNPVDLGAAATPEAFSSVLGAVLASGEADCVLAVFAATFTQDASAVVAALTAAARSAEEVSLACCLLGGDPRPPLLPQPGSAAVPVYDFPEDAVRALGVAVRIGRYRRSPRGRSPDLPGIDIARARSRVAEWLSRRPEGGWLTLPEAAALLGDVGIEVVPAMAAADVEAALRAARSTGYPVALKSADPTLVHKTERGGVHVDLAGDDDVRRAYAVAAAAGEGACGVLVQPMKRAEVEVIVGVTADPTFGPVVMLGLGGVATDLLGDRAFRLAPLTDLDAAGAARELRASPLLFGYRGRPPADVAALEDLLLRVGRLADGVPEIAELDLNPVMLGIAGRSIVDVKLRLAPGPPRLDPLLRVLRDSG